MTADQIVALVAAAPDALFQSIVIDATRALPTLEREALIVRLRRLPKMAKAVDRWLKAMRSPPAPRAVALDIGPNDEPRPTLRNAVAALRHRGGGVALDLFRCQVSLNGVPVTDYHEAEVAIWLDETHGIRVGSALAGEALRVVARDHQVHPVRDYLSGLTWDGQERVCDWLTVYLGVSDSGLHRAYGEAFMLSCVARVMEPGCKVDTVLMLLGAQGVRKSSALRTLAGDGWFADTSIDVHDKDARQALAGVWVYEWAELDALRGRESSAVKAFVSTQIDHFRPSYGRNMVDVPRQTVIVGTTNETTPLSDWTGSRRFHPVVVEAVDLDALARDRDQLWAEALHLYRSGAQWWLTPDDDAARAAASVEYTSTDPWEAAVVAWLRQNGPSTTESILAGALAKLPREQTNSDAQRISRILTPYPGVSKARRLVNGRRGSFWTIEET